MELRLLCIRHTFAFVVILSALVAPVRAYGQSSIVISQIYGGGGNSGASLRNDFVELFNRGSVSVDITGWSLQYASAGGNSWDRTLLSGSIQPGQYYLIQHASGNGGSVSLPPTDTVSGTNLSATSGKLVLASNSTPILGTSPAGPNIVDFVGYGSANASRGQPVRELSNTTAAIRLSDGCRDTGDNRADFALGGPSPRNRVSALNPCSPSAPQAPVISAAGVANAASYALGSVAPGLIVAIFGSHLGPTTLTTLQLTPDGTSITTVLGGTRVLFDGVAAPMIYSLSGQVSAIVPQAVAGRSTTTLQVEYNGVLSNIVSLPVVTAAPGIFTLDSSGKGQGAILHADYSVNGPNNRADKGSALVIFSTGCGAMTPPVTDGRIITGELPRTGYPVTVHVGGLEAELLYAGAAPGLVSGVCQVNAKIPESLAEGGEVSITITVDGATSQVGATVWLAGTAPIGAGTGPLIDQKLEQLRRDATVPPLLEIPQDRAAIPFDWLGLVSWNIQVGGTSTASGALRPSMVQAALLSMFSGSYQILAAQEVPSTDSSEFLRNVLPGGTLQWSTSFFDSTSTTDNGFWYRSGITLRDAFPLFVTGQTDGSGRQIADASRALHPPQVAQFEVGDFDFTLISLHLTFADGDTAESAREFRHVLDYLDWYFHQPDHDPDVIVCGDFNIPSRLSGQTGRAGITPDVLLSEDSRFREGERRFVVTVHEPTSRSSAASGGVPSNNYDHCVLSADTMEEFIHARRVSTEILTEHPEDPEMRLTSDHFPIVAFFKTRGEGIQLDNKRRIRQ